MFKRKQLSKNLARRKSELNTSRINKRKYYGLGVEIEKVESVYDKHFDVDAVVDSLEDNIPEVASNTEDVASDAVSRAKILEDDTDAVVEDLEEPFQDSYEKGTRRAFNSQGDSLPAPENIDDRVNDILREQRNYISKLDQDLREKAIEVIRAGVAAGLTKAVIIDNLREELQALKANRSSTVANSEVVKAGVAGTVATFEANGVDSVTWVSSQDDDVCKPGNFRVTINGTTYTSCRELDGESFELPRFPRPLLSSHPNCRCTLVSND